MVVGFIAYNNHNQFLKYQLGYLQILMIN